MIGSLLWRGVMLRHVEGTRCLRGWRGLVHVEIRQRQADLQWDGHVCVFFPAPPGPGLHTAKLYWGNGLDRRPEVALDKSWEGFEGAHPGIEALLRSMAGDIEAIGAGRGEPVLVDGKPINGRRHA